MNVLQLIIKQKYFDEILAGTKKQEFREVKTSTEKKYISCYIDEDGQRYFKNDDIPFEKVLKEVELIPYDAIQLYVGYNTNRDSALIEVEKVEIEYLEGHGFFVFRKKTRFII